MFKVNNKDTETTLLVLFWCLYCWLRTYFTSGSRVSMVKFEHVIAGWEVSLGQFGFITICNVYLSLTRVTPNQGHFTPSYFFLSDEKLGSPGDVQAFANRVGAYVTYLNWNHSFYKLLYSIIFKEYVYEHTFSVP